MAVIRILGIEDEPLHQESLYIAVEEMGYKLIGIAENKKEAMGLFFSTQPDIVLMDIALEGERDGIELAIQMNSVRPTPIIFTTSFQDVRTISDATSTNPYAYLIKPLATGNLQAAIELALYKFAADKEHAELQDGWADNWNRDILIKDSFFTKQAGKLVKVMFKDLLWIEVLKDKYVKIVTKKDEYIARTTLKEILPKLPPNEFLRVHRSFIINVPYIESIDDSEGFIRIHNEDIPLGRTFREAFLKRLNMI